MTFTRLARSGKDFNFIEIDTYGNYHSEIGSRLAMEWGLPMEVFYTTKYHHDPSFFDPCFSPYVDLIALVENILACYDSDDGILSLSDVPNFLYENLGLTSYRDLKPIERTIDKIVTRYRQVV